MANFIQPIRSPKLAYQGNMAARRQTMDQNNQTNAFALDQARQMAPVRQQQEILKAKQQIAEQTADKQAQIYDKLGRVRSAIAAYAQQPPDKQAASWPVFVGAMRSQGVEDIPEQYSPDIAGRWMADSILQADSITGGPEKAEWQKKYEWQLDNPQKAAALSKIGSIGGKGTQIFNAPYQKAEGQGMGKAFGNMFEKVIAAGYSAEESLAVLEQMRAVEVKTGAMEPAKAALAGIISGLGADRFANQIANVANAEAYEALTTQLVNTSLRANTGPQTDDDARREMKVVAALKDDPRARRFKENSMKALLLRKKQMADFIEREVVENQSHYSTARQKWNKYKNTTPNIADHITGTDGLPVFYWQFQEGWRAQSPGITDQEIENKWRGLFK